MPETLRSLLAPRTIAVVLVMLLLFGGALVLENRPWWGKVGPGLWSDAWTPSTSQHFLDPYSPSHVLHGLLLYWLLRLVAPKWPLDWRLFAVVALEIGWELLENSPIVIEHYRSETAALDYTGDSILNAMGDALTAIFGFLFAARFSWKWSVVLFVVFELWALWAARDNLILNVVMLLWPLEAIKQWQWELAR